MSLTTPSATARRIRPGTWRAALGHPSPATRSGANRRAGRTQWDRMRDRARDLSGSTLCLHTGRAVLARATIEPQLTIAERMATIVTRKQLAKLRATRSKHEGMV